MNIMDTSLKRINSEQNSKLLFCEHVLKLKSLHLGTVTLVKEEVGELIKQHGEECGENSCSLLIENMYFVCLNTLLSSRRKYDVTLP